MQHKLNYQKKVQNRELAVKIRMMLIMKISKIENIDIMGIENW